MRELRSVGLAGLLLASALTLTPRTFQTTFRISADVVQVDVGVFDRDWTPVKGLTVSNFAVFEDGKPRPIVAVEAVDFDQTAGVNTANGPTGSQTAANTGESDQLWAVVMDDAMVPADPEVAATAKVIARTVINALSARERAAVLFTWNGEAAQDFTSDRARLQASIETFHARAILAIAPTGVAGTRTVAEDWTGYNASIRTLRHVVEYFERVPGARKTLVYVSPGVPVHSGSIARLLPYYRASPARDR